MNELVPRSSSTSLSIDAGQTAFSDQQVAALRQLGVQDASPADLEVFFHVAKRTGLDPFARQLYLVGRRQKDGDNWVTKYTIQTGIDGYRLIGRRAADHARVKVSVSAPEWADREGRWHDVWLLGSSTPPAAARVTITRDGDPFVAVALFDEYAQRTNRGDLTSMWRNRPAGQIAKCAEALAWRLAFPQDLAGVYVEDELHAADAEVAPVPAPARRSGMARARAAVVGDPDADPEPIGGAPTGDVVDAELVDESGPSTLRQQKEVYGLLRQAGLGDQAAALPFLSNLAGRPIGATADLTQYEAGLVVDELRSMLADAAGAGDDQEENR